MIIFLQKLLHISVNQPAPKIVHINNSCLIITPQNWNVYMIELLRCLNDNGMKENV